MWELSTFDMCLFPV